MKMHLSIFLDDIRKLPDSNIAAPEEKKWTLVKSAKEAIELIRKGNVRRISLDHDLGNDKNGTGYDVLVAIEKFLHDGTIDRPPRMYVHTSNVSARIKMELAIRAIRKERWNFNKRKK